MFKAFLCGFAVILFVLTGQVFGQNVSNEGTDFWAVFPTHVPNMSNNPANIAVFVTSKSNTEVTVSCGSWFQTQAIPANAAIKFDVPRANAYIGLDEANGNLINRGIHIKVTDGKPKVSAYTHIYAGARSAASLILPYETLGQTYYSMNYTQNIGQQDQQGYNYLTLVAVEDNTKILIHEIGGGVKAVTLAKAGDVYEYISGLGDLTGVYAESDPATSSCKRFAAFSGTSVVTIACSGSQDPLYQQLYPTVSWGRNYGVVPFAQRRYILRILAQEDNTKVNFDNQSFTINKGQFIESGQLTESTFITADKLISVAQYSLTQGCSSVSGGLLVGDPEMVMLNPIEFNIKAVTVFSSTLQSISERYINVLIATKKTATFKVDGVAPVTPWVTLAANPLYSYNQIPVNGTSNGATFKSLTLTADDGFNAIAYGFGQAESYSYSAGTNLSSNNYLTVVNDTKNEESPNGCIGQEVDFKVNLPYQPDKIVWTLDGGTQDPVLNPIPEVKTTNGQKIYVYRYPVNKIYTQSGEYHLQVDAHVPNSATNCTSGDFTTNYVFTIYDLPTAKFDLAATGCASSDIAFTDKSLSNTTDFAITDWLWDFGDGTSPSTEQNPKHKFLKEGNYIVKLSVKSGSGCYSDVVTKTINIFPVPVSKFASLTRTCVNTDYILTDQSSISSALTPGKIVNWHWDFGDGKTEDRTDGIPFKHQFTNQGTFKISLITTSAEGCLSIAFTQDVTVTELPVADFSLPDVCLTDAFAVFINKSVDASGANGAFTYEWNYGDASATPSNPNITNAKDGKHNYRNFGEYNVVLKITNGNGCVSIKTQKFTVNGEVDKADFSIQNEANLCSNKDVIINNASTTPVGRITKIEIYQDYLNAPTVFQTINYPTTDDIHLSYPAFGGNIDRPYTIRLVAFSGESCFLATSRTIILKPVPILKFDPIPAACQNDGSVIINQATETLGIIGTGIYSGVGVDEAGNFNPKLVNEGTHIITYTFTAANGCPSIITQTINVYKSPTADAGSTIYILAGGEASIPAMAEGKALTYKWTPALGLNHDDVLNPIASPDKDTDYKLIATTSDGCTVSTTYTIKVLQALVPPNSFTPNGDGVNDVWNIKYLESYPKATIEVFNRNGSRVFFSNGYKVAFDGNYQNEPLPVGVYYYIINPRNNRPAITGPLTIIR